MTIAPLARLALGGALLILPLAGSAATASAAESKPSPTMAKEGMDPHPAGDDPCRYDGNKPPKVPVPCTTTPGSKAPAPPSKTPDVELPRSVPAGGGSAGSDSNLGPASVAGLGAAAAGLSLVVVVRNRRRHVGQH